MQSGIPKISIITPSYNQSQYLETTILSILSQQYENLEYIIIDGQSKDGSANIIEKYKDELSYWTSEPDNGQYDALNKGFSKSSGEIMGWLNSDDIYLPGTLKIVREIFDTFKHIHWITTLFPLHIDSLGTIISTEFLYGISKDGFYRGENLPVGKWFSTGFIQQESTFWRRELWEQAGGFLDTSYPMAADFELWARFFEHTDIYSLFCPLSCFRLHPQQRTAQKFDIYSREASNILNSYGKKSELRIVNILRRFLLSLFYTGKGPILYYAYPRLNRIFKQLKILENRYICIYNKIENKWEITN